MTSNPSGLEPAPKQEPTRPEGSQPKITPEDLAKVLVAQNQMINALREQVAALTNQVEALMKAKPENSGMSKEDAIAFAQIFAQALGSGQKPDAVTETIREAILQQALSSIRRTKMEDQIVDAILKAVAKRLGVEVEQVVAGVFE